MDIWITPFIILILAIVLVIYFKHLYTYWERKNVPYIEPTIPFGNISPTRYLEYGQDLVQIYNHFKKTGDKYGGFYMLHIPVFIPVDPETIRNILSKDFNYFMDRGIFYSEEEILTENLMQLPAQKWKCLRNKISPTFSPSKLKMATEILVKNGEILKEVIGKYSDSKSPIDFRKICYYFTLDNTATWAFGIECSCLLYPKTELYECAMGVVRNNIFHTLKSLIGCIWPKLLQALHIPFYKTSVSKHFISVIKKVVAYREEHNIERPDLMHLMIQMKNKENIDDEKRTDTKFEGITIEELIGECFAFFMAGYETSASAMLYCLYELAQHPEMQNKIRHETAQILKKYNGKLTYEAVMEMHYLDKVICETLRKYPPIVVLNRKCTEDYKVPGTNSAIETGTSVLISILGIHYDPEYYPDPEKFDPERFSNEEKSKRHPYTFLPYGEGPRNCLGQRFGQLQTKIGVTSLIQDFKFSLHPKTKFPLKFSTQIILLSVNDKIWLQAERL